MPSFDRQAATDCMKLAGINPSTLAVRARISLSYLSGLLSGDKTNPSNEVIRRIADALKVSPTTLLGPVEATA